jgi:hypothetical protein
MSRIEGPRLGVGAELGVGVRVVGVDGGLSVGLAVAPGAALPQPDTMLSRHATVSGIEASFLFMTRTSIG